MNKQIVIGGVVNAHVAVKFIYIKLCKGTQAMHADTVSTRALWASICGVIWLLSWVIAESIPIFNDILGLAVSQSVVLFGLKLMKWTQSSLFASWFSLAIPGILWLYLNRGSWIKDWTQTVHFSVTAIVLAVAFFVVRSCVTPFDIAAIPNMRCSVCLVFIHLLNPYISI